MIHPRTALLLAGLAAVSASAQPTASHPEPPFPDKPTLLHNIELNETALQKAQAIHASNDVFVKIYCNLGGLYEDAALYLKSEDAMRHAITLLRTGPQDQLADELGHLGMLHGAMNESAEAEKDQLEALRIRESVGDPIGLALSRNDLAAVYVRRQQYKKALDPAQKAYDVLAANPGVDPANRIASMDALAYALCGIHECDRAIPLLRDALQLASASFGPDSLSAGLASFLLGQTYWKKGDMDEAAEWMQRGTERMKVDLGWGHAIYLNAMAEYAQLLRKRGQIEAASAAEREVRQATMLVDARSFTARPQ